ncbi:hypothetical protein HanHA89_Chr10g0384561 [Helianthus annuus]|nr:hypothetical protein HanHA89_Chr10g0384561 [Helianthus annuus]
MTTDYSVYEAPEILFIFGLTFSGNGCCQNNIRTPVTAINLYCGFLFILLFLFIYFKSKDKGLLFWLLDLSLLQVSV